MRSPTRLSLIAVLFSGAVLLYALGVEITAEVVVGSIAALLAAATLWFQLTGQRPLAPSPKLKVELQVSGPGTALGDRALPEIDKDAIVDAEIEAAWETAPAVPGGSVFGERFLVDPLQRSEVESGRKSLETALVAFEEDLREWLDEYGAAVWPTVARLQVRLVIDNGSEVPAEDVVLEAVLPDGLDPWESSAPVQEPPSRPSYVGGFSRFPYGLESVIRAMPRVSDFVPSVLDRRSDGWTWPLKRAVLHAKARALSEEEWLLPQSSGEYIVRWTLWASNLKKPLFGTCTVVVPEPPPRFAPKSVADLIASGPVTLDD